MKIGVLVGSLRKESYNRKIANFLITHAPASVHMKIIDIGQLPLFSEDLEANPPKEWLEFRKQVQEVDGCLFVTPEYNRSVPGVLKNAIDVGSRPYGQSAWNGKPCAVISASMGSMGGFGANHHLRQSFVFLNAPCMPQPEAYLSSVQNLFNDKGELINEGTHKFLSTFLDAFIEWIEKNK